MIGLGSDKNILEIVHSKISREEVIEAHIIKPQIDQSISTERLKHKNMIIYLRDFKMCYV